jgi:hypothetical protein
LGKITDAGKKLHEIYRKITGLIDGYGCTEMSIEAPFFGKNVQSMLKLGRAQGVAIAAAISKDIPVFEYVPRLGDCRILSLHFLGLLRQLVWLRSLGLPRVGPVPNTQASDLERSQHRIWHPCIRGSRTDLRRDWDLLADSLG